MNGVARSLAVAALVLAAACTDEHSSSPASSGSGGIAEGDAGAHVSGAGGAAASEGGASTDVPVGAGENSGGSADGGSAGEPQAGDDTAGSDGRAGAGGGANEPIGQLPKVDVWLATKPTYSNEFRAALRTVAIKSEQLLASNADTALDAAR